MKTLEFIIEEEYIDTIYSDDIMSLVDDIGAKLYVSRASLVEYETIGSESGWTVKSCKNSLSIRTKDGQTFLGKDGNLKFYKTREEALADERLYFWDLIKEEHNGF